jgi:hypothetical protein
MIVIKSRELDLLGMRMVQSSIRIVDAQERKTFHLLGTLRDILRDDSGNVSNVVAFDCGIGSGNFV